LYLSFVPTAALLLIDFRLGQILLVLFNILEYRHLKQTSKRVSLPEYSGYQKAVVDRDDFGTDWKSVMSEELIEVQKPLAVVEPKSRTYSVEA
jgi:uncharacterized membrane protein